MNHSHTSVTVFVIAAVLTLAAAAAYVFLWFGVKAANERASALGNEIESVGRESQELAAMRALVSDTAALREKLAGYFVPADGAVPFFESLEAQGAAAGAEVSLEAASVESLPDSQSAEALKVVLRAEGSFNAVLRFIALLETAPRMGSIEQFSLSADAPGEKRAMPWRADITMRALKLTVPVVKKAL